MWCIYYADGSTFSNEDGEPHEAPTEFLYVRLGMMNRTANDISCTAIIIIVTTKIINNGGVLMIKG